MLHKHAKSLERVVSAYTHDVERHTPIHPEHAASVLDELTAEDAVFTVDTGMSNVWAARHLTPNGRRRVIGSFLHGTVANALPHAIGAPFAYAGRQVISMSGDGGLGMLMGELLTVKLHAPPVKTIVFNNSSLGMGKLEMLVEGLPDHETDHEPVDYAAIARGTGIEAIRIEHPGDVVGGLKQALAHDGPFLVDLVTDPNALSIPPHVSAAQVKGLAFAAGRTVLDGGVGKMLDPARANLRNLPRPEAVSVRSEIGTAFISPAVCRAPTRSTVPGHPWDQAGISTERLTYRMTYTPEPGSLLGSGGRRNTSP